MKKLLTIIIALFAAATLSAQTIAVWGFESDSFCLENKTGVMSDLLIDQLVGIGGITVVERSRLDDVVKELNFQNGIYTDAETVKSIGKMANADCVITGNVSVLAGELLLTARLIEVETGKILYTAKMNCETWTEFNQKLPKFAKECVSKIPLPNRFVGTWSCDFDGDYYEIVFNNDNTCVIKITSEDSVTEIETTGSYSYGKDLYSSGDFLKITARFKGTKTRIDWNSICTFTTSDNRTFNIQLKNKEKKAERVSFTKMK